MTQHRREDVEAGQIPDQAEQLIRRRIAIVFATSRRGKTTVRFTADSGSSGVSSPRAADS